MTTTITTLAALTNAALATVYNTAIVDFAPEGFEAVDKFNSKAKAVAAIEALCAGGNLAVTFDGATALIIDAMENAPLSVVGADGEGYGANDDDEADKARMLAEGGNGGEVDDEGEGGEPEADEADEAAPRALGDGKGKVRAWGVALGSAEWLAANPRHTEAREAYRTERRKAARMNRKAQRKAKEAAQASVTE